jgi:hypothetical protein
MAVVRAGVDRGQRDDGGGSACLESYMYAVKLFRHRLVYLTSYSARKVY